METKKHTLKDWFLATRPWSYPASAMPVFVTLAYLQWLGCDVNWFTGLWALLNIILFHAAANTWSDYFDFKKGVDREDTIGGVSLTSGAFCPKEISRVLHNRTENPPKLVPESLSASFVHPKRWRGPKNVPYCRVPVLLKANRSHIVQMWKSANQ